MPLRPKKWFRNFVTWDKMMIARFQQRTGMSNYKLLCVTFFKGVLIGILIGLFL